MIVGRGLYLAVDRTDRTIMIMISTQEPIEIERESGVKCKKKRVYEIGTLACDISTYISHVAATKLLTQP